MSTTGRFDQRKRPEAPQQQGPVEEGQEVEGAQHEAPTAEHSRAQHQMGNAALAAMLGGRGAGMAGAGLEVDPLRKADQELEGPGFGGDDDPVEVGPLTEVDLSRSWRPRRARTKPKKDEPKERFREPMPVDDLPDVDQAFVARLRGLPAPAWRGDLATPDPMVQPSRWATENALGAWAGACGRWAAPKVVDRLAAYTVGQRPAALQDPGGRVLIGAARVAALASWTLARSPTLVDAPTPATCALVHFCLELESRKLVARDAVAAYAPTPGEVPSGAKLFASLVETPAGGVRPGRLAPDALRALATSVAALQDLDDPARMVPRLAQQAAAATAAPEEDDEDIDPLGLDAFLTAQTGGRDDPLGPVYTSARLAAERLAGAATATAIHAAGSALALREVATLWSRGAPDHTLLEALSVVDRDVREVLKLLVEVARACQGRSVAPGGIENGLKRAARMVSRSRAKAIGMLSEVIAGILPDGGVVVPVTPPEDPLALALAERQPGDVLPWLETAPASSGRDAAFAWAALAADRDAAALVDPLEAAFHGTRADHLPTLAGPLGTALCAVLLATGAPERALDVAGWLADQGHRRRNGLVVADAALTTIAAHRALGRADDADAARLSAGAVLWHMGAVGPLLLLSRWQPPPDEA